MHVSVPGLSATKMTNMKPPFYPVWPVMMLVVSACSSGSSSESGPSSDDSPPANQSPSLSGSPPAFAMLDLIYSFAPGGSDPDGDPLTFAVTNLPPWATFDNSTGRLSGMPSMQHVGVHADILISVSDGQAAAELPAFDIEVVATATGSLALTWTPPSQSADGSTLSDLASYRIRWGTQTGDHPNVLDINNPGLASYVIDGLAPASYFLTISAVDNSNNESQPSNEASGTVP